jgi:hypothetical protein
MDNFGLIRASAASIGLAVSYLTCAAAESELPTRDRASAWFAPRLDSANREMCAAVLEAERTRFFEPDNPMPEIPGLTRLTSEGGAVIGDPDVIVDPVYPRELELVLPDRSRAFIYFFGYYGCGGACETEAIGIDAQHIVEDKFVAAHSFDSPQMLPRMPQHGPDGWRLFKSADGDFYFRGTSEYHTRWYRAVAADRWELACDIALKPDTSDAKVSPYPKTVFDALEVLRAAADRISGDYGDCGTLATGRRLSYLRAQSIETTLYRPWALSGGNYEGVLEQMKLWSLHGVMEHRALAEYQAQFVRAAAIVTDFYRAKFGWSQPRAAQMADAALTGAIVGGFSFPSEYDPYPAPGERELRQAILSKAPMEQIRGIAIDAREIDRDNHDSLLNVAVEYPQALIYLLERGFDPNIGNAFGKTPLMYAAQYNQLKSAEILLKAGANPNATTYLPFDRCEFTIGTSSLTPLHYATRYSSARMVKLLLEHGAVTFIQSLGEYGAQYPLYRVQQYTGASVKDERNPHIADGEVDELVQLLGVPSAAQRLSMAADLVTRARSEYAGGDARRAYQHLQLALLAQPDRPDAIADLPLVALRAGYIGPAVSAADRAIKILTNPVVLAASWFNKGLICEHPQADQALTLDDASCGSDKLEPFVKSWKMQPSSTRANKLRTLIQNSTASCATESGRRGVVLVDLYRRFRVYVLHPPGEKVDTSRMIGATAIETLKLGEDVVTVLELPFRRRPDGKPEQIALSIEGRECTPGS